MIDNNDKIDQNRNSLNLKKQFNDMFQNNNLNYIVNFVSVTD